MSREIKRVPFDFGWPLNKTWHGYVMPGRFTEDDCPDCESGWSPRADYLKRQWYGQAPFHPSETGSKVLTVSTPVVRAFAERNVERAPWFYGTGEIAIAREAKRLIDMWNGMWTHHLAQQDVDVLVEAGRLKNFTHTFVPGQGWQKIDPPPTVTAAQVNEWSIPGLGHDSINQMFVVEAHCEAEGVEPVCATCEGHGSLESYPGQRVEEEEWAKEDHEPPVGEGWQVWETVGDGSPISPVFRTRGGLVNWLCSPEYTWGTSTPMAREQAERFVDAAWAPTLMSDRDTGEPVAGEQAI